MALGERPAQASAYFAIVFGFIDLDRGRPLRVPELADVEVTLDAVGVGHTQPAEHDVARGLRQPLALDHPLAVLREHALAEERLEHRCFRLLDLEEERSGLVAAEPEHDVGARPDAAHADDLACRVHVAETLEQPPAVAGQRLAV